MTYSQKIISDDFIDVSPEPVRGLKRWKTEIAKVFGRGPDSRWGTQLMRIASDMILVCDESLEIRHHNRAFLKGVGFTQGTFTSKNLIQFFPSEDQDDVVEAFVRLKRGHAAGMRFNATFLTMKGRRHFDTRVVRNRNIDGTFFYYLVARDITELLDAAEKADPGFVLCLEAKPSPGLEDPKVWRQVAGRNAIAMVIQRFRTATWEKAAIRRMAAAKAAGVPTMLLWRHHIPADSPWWGVIDAVKGAPHSQVVPAHVIRIPLGGMRPEKARAILHSVLAKGAGVPGPRPPKPDPRPPRPKTFAPPSPPYTPAAHTSAGDNKPIRRIVIHSTVSPSGAGLARKIAAYFQTQHAGGSAHYVVDAAETFQCVYDNTIAWHAPPNQHSIGIEMCDMPSRVSFLRWRTVPGRAVLERTARLTAELCLAYGVPIRKLTVAQVKAGRMGICGHTDVSRAFHQSSHWDPGAFPWRRFISMVQAEATKMKEGK